MRRVVGLKKDQLFLNGKAATSKSEIRSNLEAAGFSCDDRNRIKGGQRET